MLLHYWSARICKIKCGYTRVITFVALMKVTPLLSEYPVLEFNADIFYLSLMLDIFYLRSHGEY